MNYLVSDEGTTCILAWWAMVKRIQWDSLNHINKSTK